MLWGGILLPLEIGAVVVGLSSERQTPLSGQISPVLARVPIGFFMTSYPFAYQLIAKGEVSTRESESVMIRLLRLGARLFRFRVKN